MALPSCSSAPWQAIKSIPIRAGIMTDYGDVSYSQASGVQVDVNGQAIAHAVNGDSGK